MDEDLKIDSIIKKLFGLEQKEFVLLLFFLAIFTFCIYALIVILVEEKSLLKELKKYKIIEKYKQEILLILILPIIFLILVCFGFIEFEGWLGFLGGYFGVLGAVGAIWYQKYLENKVTINNMELYTDYTIKNFSEKFENNYMAFLVVFANLEGCDFLYRTEEITKRKKTFQPINVDIINSNFSIILSNKKFIKLLNLKEKLDNLNYYIVELENDITKGEIFSPLVKNLNDFLENNMLASEDFFELKKELICLRHILSRLNLNYYDSTINFEENEILSKYRPFIEDVKKAFKDKNNILVLKSYEYFVANITKIILIINQKIEVRKFYYYTYNLLNLINIMISIYEDIEKLKSTNQ